MTDTDHALTELRDAFYIADAKLHAGHLHRLQVVEDIEGADAHSSYLDLMKLQDEERAQLAEDIFGGHFVRQDEIDEVGRNRAIFNGCTNTYLAERYGDRVGHLLGVGWFIDRPEASTRVLQATLV